MRAAPSAGCPTATSSICAPAQRTFDDLAAYVPGADDARRRRGGARPRRRRRSPRPARSRPPACGRGSGGRSRRTDEVPGAPPVVVLTERLWRGRYDGDAAVIGREVSRRTANRRRSSASSAIARDSRAPRRCSCRCGERAGASTAPRDPASCACSGGSAAGATPPTAAADLDAVAAHLAATFTGQPTRLAAARGADQRPLLGWTGDRRVPVVHHRRR